MKVVILAGGSGTRLWPFSREKSPKQILPLLGKETLLQQSYQRLRLRFKPEDILVVAGKKYAATIFKQLPGLLRSNVLLEPVRRDTAGAIGLAAAWLYGRNPQETMVSIHSDHWVSDEAGFAKIIKELGRLSAANPEQTIIVGAKPTYPETGYGYIQLDKKVVHLSLLPKVALRQVKRFKEKPDLKTAERFVAAGDYLWNVGWFAWRVDYLMELFQKHLPENARLLQKIAATGSARWQRVVDRIFPKLKAASIDNSLIEKTNQRLVAPINIGWTDIGHWRSVHEMSKKDKDGNAVIGKSMILDSANNLFVLEPGKALMSVGVNNLVLIETSDVILVAAKDKTQQVKQIVERLKQNKSLRKYL